MPDASESSALLERLAALHPRKIDLSLDRIRRLLERLDHPERRLPAVIHVAGTNGKGSAVAFARAILEAAGQRVHVYTSPHLIAFRERIRLAGRLVEEPDLAGALRLCEERQRGEPITFFEITTAAALHLFAERPADALLLEVGLGGRYDATNVIDAPVASVITPVSFDHQEFLGDTLAQIASEKAGVAKRGVPLVTARQEPEALRSIEREARRVGAPLLLEERDFEARVDQGRLVYEDAAGLLDLPTPKLLGRHQVRNAGVAIAALRAAFPRLAAPAYEAGVASAQWPARLQRLSRGRLVALAPDGAELWIDGAHNEAGAQAAAEAMADLEDRAPKPLVLVCGMLTTKDPSAFFAAFRGLAEQVLAVDFQAEAARPADETAASARALGLQASAFVDVEAALTALAAHAWPQPPRVLIAGSLYLAGEALARNGCRLD